MPVDARTRLKAAVLALAASTSVTALSVAEVCREAGVTRDTFYRLAISPAALLASALRDELAQLPEAGAADGRTVMSATTTALFEHVTQFRAVYANALEPHLGPDLRAVLAERIEAILLAWIATHGSILPRVAGRVATDAETSMLVAYAVSGAVGAVESWLVLPTADLGEAVDTLEVASAAWWFTA